jgi:hypothetical protein
MFILEGQKTETFNHLMSVFEGQKKEGIEKDFEGTEQIHQSWLLAFGNLWRPESINVFQSF